MKVSQFFFIASLLFALPLAAQNPAAGNKPPVFDLQDGDSFVFYGDSITHQSLYTQYVEDFFYTRYPDRKILFHNAGVSGDKAADALARFEDDVAFFKPKYVSVLLGMNDGQYEDFNAETFATYQKGMIEILEKIEAIGATAIPLSPTMFDHHQLSLQMKTDTFRFKDRSFSPQYNALMAFYGAWLQETSGSARLPFVNLWGPLNDFTFSQRRTKPDFSLVEDTIHPGPAGQFIMAYSILSQFRPERRSVSYMSIQKEADQWTAKARGAKVTGIMTSDDGNTLTFTAEEQALPWVVPEVSSNYELKWGPSTSPAVGMKLTAAGHRLSNQSLQVAGLNPGTYELSIDDQVVGEFTHLKLGFKVELQSNEKTPQHQQAEQVANLNRERNDDSVRPLRDTWARVKGLRRNGDQEKFDAEYPELKKKIDALNLKALKYQSRIYALAQPIPRKYQLRRVNDAQ